MTKVKFMFVMLVSIMMLTLSACSDDSSSSSGGVTEATGIVVNPLSVEVNVGSTLTNAFTVQITPSGASQDFTVVSNNTSIVTVTKSGDEVTLVGEGRGTTAITITSTAKPSLTKDVAVEVVTQGDGYVIDSNGDWSISNANGLIAFGNAVNTIVDGSATGIGLNASLTDNITLTEVWTSMGSLDNPYGGTFNGNGFIIDGLRVTAASGTKVGFFGYNEGEILNVGFNNANASNTEGNYAAVVVGTNFGRVAGVFVTNSIVGVPGDSIGGGIAGSNEGDIEFSYVDGIQFHGSGGTSDFGGIVGEMIGGAMVSNTYANNITNPQGGRLKGISGIDSASVTDADYAKNFFVSTASIDGRPSSNTNATKLASIALLNDNVTTTPTNGYMYVKGDPSDTELPTLAIVMNINNVADLKAFRDAVNSGQTNISANLMADITLDASDEWTPIGNSDNIFTGKFFGNEYEISNIYINQPTLDNQGFFGYVGGGASITDLGIVNANITGDNNTGGVAGYIDALGAEQVQLYNVYVKSSNITGGATTTASNVGGVVGYMNDVRLTIVYIENSTISVTATGANIGGIYGYSTGTVSVRGTYSNAITLNATQDTNAGGILGRGAGPLESYVNALTINSNGATGSYGGIAGYRVSGSTDPFTYFISTSSLPLNGTGSNRGTKIASIADIELLLTDVNSRLISSARAEHIFEYVDADNPPVFIVAIT